MPWTQKQMLRDANGDLIPQYWDVAEQDFKPLTGQGGANDVRLTGSIVELNKEVYDSQSSSVIITPGSYYNLLSHAYYPFKEIRGHLRWRETPSDYHLMLYYRVSEISFGLFENVELTGERTEFQFDLSGGHFELRLYNDSTEDAYLRLFEVVGVV